MRRTHSLLSIGLLFVSLATPLAAQTTTPQPQAAAPPAAARPMNPANLRRHIYIIEGALVRAVAFGAQDLNRKIRSTMPEVMALSGEPQARGVYLEGYGVYFDVAVPVLNQVMITTYSRMLGPDDGVITAFNQLRSYLQAEKNATTRASLEAWLRELEVQMGPLAMRVGSQPDLFGVPQRPTPGTSGAPMVAPTVPPMPPLTAPAVATEPKFDRKSLQDPNAVNRAYTESVQNALIETIIDQIQPLAIKPEEYLTIAARDNMQRDSLAPWDPYEEVVTILLRFKGSDIAAYRAGQIDALELRKRIEVREF
jgi:hypothetical protein